MSRSTASSASQSTVKGGFWKPDVLLAASAALMALTLYMVYFWVPTDANLGVSQRIFYFHVPLAMIGIGALLPVAIGSVMYLAKRQQCWDWFGYSCAEAGLLFATLGLVTGSIWAKPVWGQWWTWDPKLTLTAIIWFIYVAYMMVRAYSPPGSQQARFASVVAIIGVIASTLNYLATSLWRTAHPETNIGPLAQEADAIASSAINLTLMAALVTFVVLFAAVVAQRYSMKTSEAFVDEMYRRVSR